MGDILSGIGSVATGVGSLLGRRDRRDTDVTQFRPLPFTDPFRTPSFAVGPSGISRLNQLLPQRQAELGVFTRSLRGGLQDIRGGLTDLRGEVRPGFGRLSRIASTTIRQAGAQAVGNLRSQLQRRNVLGASFADDAIARVQSEFAQREEQALAQAAINEIAATLQIDQLDLATSNALLQQAQTEAALVTQQIQQELAELGIGAEFFSNVRIAQTESNVRQGLLDEFESSGPGGGRLFVPFVREGRLFGGSGPGSRGGLSSARGSPAGRGGPTAGPIGVAG